MIDRASRAADEILIDGLATIQLLETVADRAPTVCDFGWAWPELEVVKTRQILA